MRKNRWLLIGLSALMLSSSITACGKYTVKLEKVEEQKDKEETKSSKKKKAKETEEDLDEDVVIDLEEDEEEVDEEETTSRKGKKDKETEDDSKEEETKDNVFGNKSNSNDFPGKVQDYKVQQYEGFKAGINPRYAYLEVETEGNKLISSFMYGLDNLTAGDDIGVLIVASMPLSDFKEKLREEGDFSEKEIENLNSSDILHEVVEHMAEEAYFMGDYGVYDVKYGNNSWCVLSIDLSEEAAKELGDYDINDLDCALALQIGKKDIALVMSYACGKNTVYDDVATVMSTLEINNKKSEVELYDISSLYGDDNTTTTTDSTKPSTSNTTTTSSSPSFTINGVTLNIRKSTLADVYKAVNGEEPKVNNYGSSRYYMSFSDDESNTLSIVTDGKSSDSPVVSMRIEYSQYDKTKWRVSEFPEGMKYSDILASLGNPESDDDASSYGIWYYDDYSVTVHYYKDTGVVWSVEVAVW